MRLPRSYRAACYLLVTMLLPLIFAACGGSRDETISGVAIPVPNALKKGPDKQSEISILGFGAGQASFHGNMDREKLVEFFKKEMPARGWQENLNLRSASAILAFSKDGKSVLIGIGRENDGATLTLTVSGARR